MDRRQFVTYMTAIAGTLLSNPARTALSLEEVQSAFSKNSNGQIFEQGTDFLKIENDTVEHYLYSFQTGGKKDNSGLLTIFDDAKAQQALKSIYLPLAQKSTRWNNLKWRVILADSSQTRNKINASTPGGGLTIVHSDLIRLCKTETELASVLAHEIGHIEHKHAIRRLMSQDVINKFKLPVDWNAYKDEQRVTSFSKLMDVSTAIFFKSFRRSWEHQADSFSVNLVSQANYDLTLASQLFRNLVKHYRINPQPQNLCIFSTYPDMYERIERIESIAKTLSPQRQVRPDSEAFRYLKNRIG